LDVIEEKDGVSYPVETKHGSAPRDDDGRPTAWDNDAVQLCGQALLMEEAFAAPVERGIQTWSRLWATSQRFRATPNIPGSVFRVISPVWGLCLRNSCR
jgi:hypothetical protein